MDIGRRFFGKNLSISLYDLPILLEPTKTLQRSFEFTALKYVNQSVKKEVFSSSQSGAETLEAIQQCVPYFHVAVNPSYNSKAKFAFSNFDGNCFLKKHINWLQNFC